LLTIAVSLEASLLGSSFVLVSSEVAPDLPSLNVCSTFGSNSRISSFRGCHFNKSNSSAFALVVH